MIVQNIDFGFSLGNIRFGQLKFKQQNGVEKKVLSLTLAYPELKRFVFRKCLYVPLAS